MPPTVPVPVVPGEVCFYCGEPATEAYEWENGVGTERIALCHAYDEESGQCLEAAEAWRIAQETLEPCMNDTNEVERCVELAAKLRREVLAVSDSSAEGVPERVKVMWDGAYWLDRMAQRVGRLMRTW